MQGSRRLLATLGSIALLSITSSSYALMSVPNGWYGDFNVGSTNVSDFSNPPNTSVGSSGIGGNLNVGYKFMPYFGAEIDYTRYANSTVKDSMNDKLASIRFYSYGLVGKGILPFADTGIEAFGKLGVQRISSRLSITNSNEAAENGLSGSGHSTTGLYFGAGVSYYVMPEIAFVGQWARAVGNSRTGTLDLTTLGVSMIFD